MPNTFPCPACGAPVEPAPNRSLMPCPYCGASLTIPTDLRWNQTVPPAPSTPTSNERPAFDPFKAAAEAKFSTEKAEKEQAEAQWAAETLRKAQPLAAGAVNAYAWWGWLGNRLRRALPGCLIALTILCVLAGSLGIFLLFFSGQGH